MLEFCRWLEATAVSRTFAAHDAFVPSVQITHLLAIATLVTVLTMLNARQLGLIRSGPGVEELASTWMPVLWLALAILVVTGTLLTITEPIRELMNMVYRIKMLLVLPLAFLMWLFQRRVRQPPAGAVRVPHGGPSLTTLAILSQILVVCIVTAGRLIAYA